MNTRTYLIVNGVGYLALGLWCVLQPYKTSDLIGLMIIGNKGLAEYAAVYGGLEFGLGIFYLLSVFRAELSHAAIVFSCCLYGGIVLFRGGAMALYDAPTTDIGWVLFVLEITLFVASILLLRKRI